MDIDTIDTGNSKENSDAPILLQEKDFIQENNGKSPRPFWSMLAIFAAVIALFWGMGSVYYQTMLERLEKSPFLQVTNRQMSLFLWQFPEYMPQHVREKTGYLPGFEYRARLGVTIQSVDAYVQAPPELLFLYHTWARLLQDYYIPQPILRVEFMEFLKLQAEWKPKNWPDAPSEYRQMVQSIKLSSEKNLEQLSLEALPIVVRQAFQGWKNYRLEGNLINSATFKYSELQAFLKRYAHYSRNYWRNIVDSSYPNYLLTYTSQEFKDEEAVPKEEISSFLRVALFNAVQGKKVR